jgi:hypothetical protein
MWQLYRSFNKRLPRTSSDAIIVPDSVPPRYHTKIRVETFPGAACYKTLSNAMAFRAIMRGVWQQSKAAPLHHGWT